MTALFGPVRTGKSQTIMSLISGTYCMVDNKGASDLRSETMRRQCIDDNRRGRFISNQDLANTVRRDQLPRVMMLAPRNNAVDVL